ncbi:MAG: hypothetical protein PVF58_16630 [Candidatus Methanofastidiosia archaeon]
MYAIVQTRNGYYVLKDKVFILDGMQLRFLYDISQNVVPDLDMVVLYFKSLKKFQELCALNLVGVRPQRVPSTGEKRIVVSDQDHVLYYGIKASVFKPYITEKGRTLLDDVRTDTLFRQCLEDMDKKMAETLLTRGSS